MSTAAALWYFESVNLYRTLCPHKVKKMGETHEFLTFKKNEFVYIPDDRSTHVYLVVDGRIKIGHYLEDGKEVVSAILTTGEIFGELAVAGEEKRRDFAQAMTKSVLCPLTIEELRELMYQDRELSFKVLKLVGLRLVKLERKLELLVFRDARTRVIEFLRDAASWKGRKVGTETMIPTRLTHKEIAALTGVSRQTATSILNDLKDKNLIYFDRKQILVRDMDALK